MSLILLGGIGLTHQYTDHTDNYSRRAEMGNKAPKPKRGGSHTTANEQFFKNFVEYKRGKSKIIGGSVMSPDAVKKAVGWHDKKTKAGRKR